MFTYYHYLLLLSEKLTAMDLWKSISHYRKLTIIIGQGWAKYRDLSVVSRWIICQTRKLRQIMDLQDTDKSWYFAITKFKNCFITRSPSLFFKDYIFGKWSNLPFSRKSDRKKEKSVVSFTHEQNIICSKTKLNDIEHEQTVICRQWFTGHMVGSRPMKRKKNL